MTQEIKGDFGIEGFEIHFDHNVDSCDRCYMQGYAVALRKFFGAGVRPSTLALMITEAAMDKGILQTAQLNGEPLLSAQDAWKVARDVIDRMLPKDGQG